MYQHQDWTPVVFKKNTEQKERNKEVAKTVSQFQPQYKAQLDENTESFQTKLFDKDYAETVIRKRIEKKWNQKQLASAINVDVHVIQRLEQGKEVYDHAIKMKLNRILNIKSH